MLNVKQYNDHCINFRKSTHSIQWGGSHVWKVGGKVFAIGYNLNLNTIQGFKDQKEPVLAITFKTSEIAFEYLKDLPGCRPAPYLASRGMKWIQRFDDSHLSDEMLITYIETSYNLVVEKLTKKRRQELDL